MVLGLSEVRRIVERVCARQDVLDACAERDLGYVIAVFEKNGLTQVQMASLTGLHQNRLSDYKTGKHRPKEYSVFAAFADGMGFPPAARQALGLDASPPEAAGIGVPQPRPAPFAEISLEYPGTAGQAAGNVVVVVAGRPRRSGRAGAGRGLTRARGRMPRCAGLSIRSARRRPTCSGGVRVGMGDVERFRVTVEAFRQLDDRFGGGHARQALIQYLNSRRGSPAPRPLCRERRQCVVLRRWPRRRCWRRG